MDEIPSEDLWSFTTVRLEEEIRALHALTPFLYLREWRRNQDRRSPRSVRVSGPLVFPRPGSSGRVHNVGPI
jgi:hypothetical protein